MTSPSETDGATSISRDDFCSRFSDHMVKLAVAGGGDAIEVGRYAAQVAPTYFDDQHHDDPETAPESWAEVDMSYWED